MIFKEYETQYNVHPASDLETYCKLEGASMLFIRKPDKNKVDAKKLEQARIVIGNKIVKLGLLVAGSQNKGLAT
ncbi:MAG: hypothetical protein GX352_04995 [Clostridiales bacterium]|nr:hypothetical protein [Clostridiales bacterium]